MRGISFLFMALAALCALIGMAWGIAMSASGDHAMFPAHAHLNLVGWVGFAIFAFYYHLVPEAAESLLAKAHAGLAIAGVVTIVPGIVMALTNRGEALAKLGSILTMLSMLAFFIVVLTNRLGRTRAVAA